MEKRQFDPKLNMIGQEMLRHIDEVLSQALEIADKIDPGEGSAKMLLAVMAMAAPIQFLAGAIAATPEEGSKVEGICKETLLIAGLIAGRSVQGTGHIGRIDFSCRNILAAIEAAGKITGADMSKYCDTGMVKAFREFTTLAHESLGYWDYLQGVGPSFDGFDGLSAYSSSRH